MALLPRPDYSNGLLPWRCFLFAMRYGHGIATDLERAMGYCHGIAYYMRWATAMASLRGATIFYYGRPRTRTGETSKNQHRQPWPQKPTGQGGHEPEGHSPRGAVARARRPRTGRSRSGHNIYKHIQTWVVASRGRNGGGEVAAAMFIYVCIYIYTVGRNANRSATNP